ncbi:Subtilisin-like protease 8 [Rhizoctonia solani]|uniref:Subtilisin-like protease 8 n=1 Tax=Rhizoctonia solani TaxID=456999 RepID=A0A0K6FM42_9AGAM|nr:Subtilisin-like protease 8 [Rhizoctonia solani]
MITVAVAVGLLVAPALASPLSTSTEPLIRGNVGLNLAPVVSHPAAEQAIIPNQYIVVLKPEATLDDLNSHAMAVQSHDETNPLTDGSGLMHIFDGALKGVAGKFSDATLDKIRAMPEVEYVERDQVVYAIHEPAESHATQKGAPWGLARISHRKKLGFSNFNQYIYDSEGGEGVDVYVIDTGINVEHEEFHGRAHWGHTVPQNDVDADGNGHGTHCAGTIASDKYGVAKKAQVYAVKVLGSNGSGSMSDVVAGVTWASKAAQAKAIEAIKEFRATGKTSHKGSVANMSLGGGKSPALDRAVNAAVRKGMHFAVAAGNDNRDACNYSPAAAELAVTVGASTLADERAYFSNHGSCVDVFAPGLNILSTWIGSKDATNVISGTSMASPHTAGLLAYLLSIHGSATFNPDMSKYSHNALVSNWNPTGAIMSILPSWMTAFIPASFIEQNMPASMSAESFYNEDGTLDVTQFGAITPAQLKAALIDLGERDKISELPPNTVNLLIFNNATDASGHAWY